jgi:biopolymer transport protein ExbD
MGMSVGSSEGDEDEVNSTINTTPLVDVMLVLLIIFLITIPVVVKTVPLKLPEISNEATKTKPENIIIAVTADGKLHWNETAITQTELYERMQAAALKTPQPEVHIRGDRAARYEHIGRVVATAGRSGILKVGFITDPEMRQ